MWAHSSAPVPGDRSSGLDICFGEVLEDLCNELEGQRIHGDRLEVVFSSFRSQLCWQIEANPSPRGTNSQKKSEEDSRSLGWSEADVNHTSLFW